MSRQIPETDEACQWDWRHARCEPNCECGLEYKFGDFHLGRSCRRRSVSVANNSTCSEPPTSPYAKLFDATVTHGRALSSQMKTSFVQAAIQGKNRVKHARSNVCESVPTSCDDDANKLYKRTIKERLMCTHIPTCDEIVEPDEDDFKKTAVKKDNWYWA